MNAVRLQRKRTARRQASYDGQGSAVSPFDVALSAALAAAALGACASAWWFAR